MIKKRYYKNECFDLAWDLIKVSQSNQFITTAEAAQASLKAANETSASLVDAIYYDISDSARLEAKWESRKNLVVK